MSSETKTTEKTEPVMTSAFWFTEAIQPDLEIRMSLHHIGFDAKSDFQRVQVIRTGPFGKTLVLDGKTQSALGDEYVYHETLVHPSLLAHPNPKKVFIGGGGEGATAREVLRHKSVERLVMVDIDKTVVDICREQLPEWSQGAFEDPRMETHYTDAKAWLEETDETFDVIIMDIADPIEAGPGYVLYTEEFYKFAISRLSPGGVLVTQSGPGSAYSIEECFTTIHRTLQQAFNCVVPFTADVPSFGSDWGFNMAFNADGDAAEAMRRITERSAAETDALIAERITGELEFLDGVSHRGLFGVSKRIRKRIAEEKRIMTVDNPVFMF
mmetsp:Transcript_19808/g.62903  ORF Transcript_19808/g.62903 Transcript_19808/m.62903 type:complete len:326 (+) Transcript_19808:36-1013(+)|eukprot:CAMPEP_0196780594 /NCGR_PEP_ID=MMETSP1104-20130614/8077_1 /TAXON_ID=33652 /ORGANISM="Cafeteria sp., Strain Caron Lab Isolate" /LENGTH=325 /DNA_ID=CAMNT_0042150807 /DNA_START=15 /DNA_END=992 /DNA_ORIENTATION=+